MTHVNICDCTTKLFIFCCLSLLLLLLRVTCPLELLSFSSPDDCNTSFSVLTVNCVRDTNFVTFAPFYPLIVSSRLRSVAMRNRWIFSNTNWNPIFFLKFFSPAWHQFVRPRTYKDETQIETNSKDYSWAETNAWAPSRELFLDSYERTVNAVR